MKQSRLTKLTSKIIAYRKTHTLEETGSKFTISSERVRQICLTKFRKYCNVHKRLFYNTCTYCLNSKYQSFLKKLSTEDLYSEIKKEAHNRKRDDHASFRRMYIVGYLRDTYDETFVTISTLLKREYSTIRHLYRNYKQYGSNHK